MREEKVIMHSNDSQQCGYLEYHLTTERGFNIIHFQRINDWISGETHTYHLLSIMSLKLTKQSYQTYNR